MNRLQAIQSLRNGGYLKRSYYGQERTYGKLHTYSLLVSKRHTILHDVSLPYGEVVMPTKAKDVLAFIKKHYPRNSDI